MLSTLASVTAVVRFIFTKPVSFKKERSFNSKAIF